MTRSRDSLADWFTGGAGKRSLLGAIAGAKKGDRFTQSQFAKSAGLHEKGGAARHLAVLEQAGLVVRDSQGVYTVVSTSQLLKPLRRWLRALEDEEAASGDWRRQLPPSRGR